MSTAMTAAAARRSAPIINTSRLRAICRNVEGRTQLTDRYHEAPLKITKTFREEGSDALALILMDASPGLMDGDRYQIEMQLMENTHLILTNQSYTKVHPTPHAGAQTDFRFDVGRGAVLEFMPEPTIPYAGSRLRAVNRFELAEGSALLFADIATAGRTHRGERFQFEEMSNRLEVYRSGELIAWDYYRLQPAVHDYALPGAMESYTHSGAFWIFAEQADKPLLELVRAQLAAAEAEFSAEVLAGASLTANQGIVVRMLGSRVWMLEQLRDRIWAACRDSLWHSPAFRLL